MKSAILLITVLFLIGSDLKANESIEIKNVFSKKDILNLADQYINNNAGIKNPVIVDVDKDGNFDILNFTSKGNVEYYRNTGTLENPFFVLENKNFDHYKLNSFLPNGIPIPVFFADRDGDKDYDVFGIVKDGYDSKTFKQKYKAVYVENTMDIDNYTLITIVLVLLIIALLLVILK